MPLRLVRARCIAGAARSNFTTTASAHSPPNHARRRAWQLRVPVNAPDLRAFLYDNGSVLSERYVPDEGWTLKSELEEHALHRLQKRFGCVAVSGDLPV